MSGDGDSISLSVPDEDGYVVLTVAEGVAEGSETMILRDLDEEGLAAGAEVNTVVHPYSEHKFGEWITTTAATCTEEGSSKDRCDRP